MTTWLLEDRCDNEIFELALLILSVEIESRDKSFQSDNSGLSLVNTKILAEYKEIFLMKIQIFVLLHTKFI